MFEKLMLSEIISKVDQLESESNFVQLSKDGEFELPPENEWEQMDVIRTSMRHYLDLLVYVLVQLKSCISSFEQQYSIETRINEQESLVG
jgi:hypothetical protein